MNNIFPKSIKNVFVTGGGGFIGGTLIRRLLKNTQFCIYNLDKLGYASNLLSIELELAKYKDSETRYKLIKSDISDLDSTRLAIKAANPDFVFHLAAESHVDRSIHFPDSFLKSNVQGTHNLLTSITDHWENLDNIRKESFRFLHVSTDEVFGSLGSEGFFNEQSRYDPRSPYSATKASSDHLVKAWNHTFGLPTLVTNCSNNYGPWQFPEKLIPLTINKALSEQEIPLYGNGKNIRDWLFVEDHIDALLTVITKGDVGRSYCIGGSSERTNIDVMHAICSILDDIKPLNKSYKSFIKYVKDRPGHDYRYAIDSSILRENLGWRPKYNFDLGLTETVLWYAENQAWSNSLLESNQ